MNCKASQVLLSAFLDRELPSEEYARVRAHLAECDTCAAELASLRVLKAMLSQSPAAEPDPYFEERLITNVMQRVNEPLGQPKFAWLRPAVAFGGLAVASMLFTLLAIQMMPSRSRPRPTASPEAPEIAFDVQRDQVYSVGTDAFGGMPVIDVSSQAQR